MKVLEYQNRRFMISALSMMMFRVSYCIPAIAGYFGTKARYEEVNPHLIDDILSVNQSQVGPPAPGCTPVYLVAVIRHGTRYPTTKNIRRISRLYDLVMNEASNPEPWLSDIKAHWKMWYTEDMDGKLSEKGKHDLRSLAVRLAKSFPDLVSEENVRSKRVDFITSSKHRCVDSIKAFQEGLHQHWGVQDLGFKHGVNDSLMRFFDQCPRFVEDVDKNKMALKEVDLFKSSSEMDEVRRRLARRLQVPDHHITTDLAEAAFFLCSYEFAIKSENSLWCDLLAEEEARVLEYKNDLKQFWKRGYGHDVNRKSSCSLFHDIFRRLDQASYAYRGSKTYKLQKYWHPRSGEPIGAFTVQVGHAETLLPLLSLLGFFKDETALTAENFRLQHERKFRSGKIVPYAANLLFVLHGCGDGLRLQFFLNEKPLAFPDLDHASPLYSTVRALYSDLLGGCDFNKECELNKDNVKNKTEL